jgi:hypothetical protein
MYPAMPTSPNVAEPQLLAEEDPDPDVPLLVVLPLELLPLLLLLPLELDPALEVEPVPEVPWVFVGVTSLAWPLKLQACAFLPWLT